MRSEEEQKPDLSPSPLRYHQTAGDLLTVSVTEASSRITEYTRPLLLIVTLNRKKTQHIVLYLKKKKSGYLTKNDIKILSFLF